MVSAALFEEQALALAPEDRARLADKLWASVADEPSFTVVMTPELERLLDEGIEGIERAKPTVDLRGGR